MTLEHQCCTLDQAKKLRELGVKQESYFVWKCNDIQEVVSTEQFKRWCEEYLPGCNDYYSAFSVAELGIMLPEDFIKFFDFPGYVTPKSQEYELSFRQWFFKNGEGNRTFGCRYDYMGNINISTGNFLGTEAQARAAMLIHLIENNLVEVSEINNRLNK